VGGVFLPTFKVAQHEQGYGVFSGTKKVPKIYASAVKPEITSREGMLFA
jgi:hypothetical protein